jgi:hypothetical protein
MMRRVLEEWEDCDEDVFRRGLREIVALRAVLASLESEFVAGARLQGHHWPALAEDLGLSPGGARKRHVNAEAIRARKPYREPTLAEALAQLIVRDPD